MHMAKLGRSESLVKDACTALVKLIGRISETGGSDLPTTAELCRQFGVSRPVLREAISRLEQQGLVEVRHGVGLRIGNQLHRPVSASVSLLVPDEEERLRQTMAARLLLEVEIARLAATRVGEVELAALAETQDELLQASSSEAAVAADMQFHRLLAGSCGNQVLALMLESVAEFGRQSRKRTIARAGVERAYRTHQDILEALRDHNAEESATAMRRHLKIALEDLVE
jgi:GntR family transcriptional repressor for pyruvate dehydrogenase complex